MCGPRQFVLECGPENPKDRTPCLRTIYSYLGHCSVPPTGLSSAWPSSVPRHTVGRVNFHKCKSDHAISLPETIQRLPIHLRLRTHILKTPVRLTWTGPLLVLQAHLPVLSHFLRGISHTSHLSCVPCNLGLRLCCPFSDRPSTLPLPPASDHSSACSSNIMSPSEISSRSFSLL